MGNLKHTKTIITFILFLSLLITFDAYQQKFYIDQFHLGASKPISSFLLAHFTRWSIWLTFSLPIVWFAWLKFTNSTEGKHQSNVKIISLSLCSIFGALVFTSVISLYSQNVPFTKASFLEFLTFFFYQKGLTFLMAQVGLILVIYSIRQSKQITAQWVEIESLKAENNKEYQPKIIVKNGDLHKPLELENISWIQADDYCVRVHTQDQSYYLRKSL